MSSEPATGAIAHHLTRVVEQFALQNYAASGAAGFGIDQAGFLAIFTEVVAKSCPSAESPECLRLLQSIHIAELVLTRACANGSEAAWTQFLTRYRGGLYAAAYRIAGNDTIARELADSLYAELYGVGESGQQRACKLRYYLGRGSLEGWLRTILAQAYVDRYRKTRRETSLEAETEQGVQFRSTQSVAAIHDQRLDKAVADALQQLGTEDRLIVASYFLDGRKLAEIARLLGVHESTISRKLDRATDSLRKQVRKNLVSSGMSSREAEEAMEAVDVRDLQVKVSENIKQGTRDGAFYQRQD